MLDGQEQAFLIGGNGGTAGLRPHGNAVDLIQDPVFVLFLQGVQGIGDPRAFRGPIGAYPQGAIGGEGQIVRIGKGNGLRVIGNFGVGAFLLGMGFVCAQNDNVPAIAQIFVAIGDDANQMAPRIGGAGIGGIRNGPFGVFGQGDIHRPCLGMNGDALGAVHGGGLQHVGGFADINHHIGLAGKAMLGR